MDMDATSRGIAWELGIISTSKGGSRAVRSRTWVAGGEKRFRYSRILARI